MAYIKYFFLFLLLMSGCASQEEYARYHIQNKIVSHQQTQESFNDIGKNTDWNSLSQATLNTYVELNNQRTEDEIYAARMSADLQENIHKDPYGDQYNKRSSQTQEYTYYQEEDEKKAQNSSSRSNYKEEEKKYSCWDAPEWCLKVEEKKWNGDSFRVKYHNVCKRRLYVKYCNKRRDGSWSCGSSGVGAGNFSSWSTYDATGRYKYKFIGVEKPSDDWVCAGKTDEWYNGE